MYNQTRFLNCGDTAVVMEFGNEISKDINAKIRACLRAIEDSKIDGIVEVVPTYRSVLIQYDPLKIKYDELIKTLKSFEVATTEGEATKVKLIEIPTLYGGEFGPDIEFVAEHNSISVDEVIKIHSGTDYLVYMLGFIPGFTYLGGMSEKIATPRLKTPRTKIDGGSVGIAGTQTGMYPSDSPGGWQIIGRTPLKLFDANSEPPVFINAGDYVRYVPITRDEYFAIEEQVKKNEYKPIIRIVEGSELNG